MVVARSLSKEKGLYKVAMSVNKRGEGEMLRANGETAIDVERIGEVAESGDGVGSKV